MTSFFARVHRRCGIAASGSSWWMLAASATAFAALLGAMPQTATAQSPSGHENILAAREAWTKRDRPRLASALTTAQAADHPLTIWVDYWQLNARLAELSQRDLDAFYARWPGSYLEDRLRNDWLLELGKRRDWSGLRAEYPRFVLKDDREAACYWLTARHLDGENVRAEARAAWLAQRDADDGCALLATTLRGSGVLTDADIWHKLRLSTEANRPRMARQVAELLSTPVATAVSELSQQPVRYLARNASTRTATDTELAALALIRAAAVDTDVAVLQMRERWAAALPEDTAAWVWASMARQSAIRLRPNATELYREALKPRRNGTLPELPQDTLAWKVRAALRGDAGQPQWPQVLRAIDAMGEAEQGDSAWVYWKARALQALAPDSPRRDELQTSAATLFESIAGPLDFYGKLAAEALNLPVALPAPPAPLTRTELSTAAAQPWLQRSLLLIELGLRSEGVREWNYSLRGLGERELLAIAQQACDRQVWDRCINTSERTRTEIDLTQRFPTPLRTAVVEKSREAGVEPAYVYGLIRQESRFIMDARSSVGASGLMQLMPATARWTARKLGIESYAPGRINEQDINLRLGTGYLRMMLDSFEGSQAMAAAGYNAGPSRPRRWREGPALEAAVWAETIPFNETRDYVKKVLSNATVYAALLDERTPSLRERLGATIGPRTRPESEADRELP